MGSLPVIYAYFSVVLFFHIHPERGYVVFGTISYFKFVVKFLRRPYLAKILGTAPVRPPNLHLGFLLC